MIHLLAKTVRDAVRSGAVTILVPVVMLAGCATALPPLPAVPDALKAPDSQVLKYVVQGKGVQIYVCHHAKTGDGFVWEFTAPEAQLTEPSGKPFGHHYAGPTWEALDGSKVVGQVKAKDAGPDPTAVPWLLLVAASTSGSGQLGTVSSVQRLKTVGGQAPATGCDEGHLDQTLRVSYEAQYRFYVPGS